MKWHIVSCVAWLYVTTSCLCLLLYAIDKHRAVQARRRIRERTLLGVGLIGGWPGALLAQRLWRHKTTKRSFRRLFRASVAVNLLVLLACASLWMHPLR